MKTYLNYIKESTKTMCSYEDTNDVNKYIECVKIYISEYGVNSSIEYSAHNEFLIIELIHTYNNKKNEDDIIYHKLFKIIEEIITDKTFDVNMVVSQITNRSTLMCAAELGEPEIVRALLKRKDININQLDSNNNNALIWLADEESIWDYELYIETFYLLIDNGINVNQRNIYNLSYFDIQITAEELEIENIHTIFKVLLENGYKLNDTDFKNIENLKDDNSTLLELIVEYDNELYKRYLMNVELNNFNI